jgi:hypothetical protein
MNDAQLYSKSEGYAAKSAQGHSQPLSPEADNSGGAGDKSSRKQGDSEKHCPRDNATLRFIGLHKLLIYLVWSRVFLGDERKQCAHIVTRFKDRKDITVHERQLPGGISYVTLTRDCRQRLGLPRERSPKISSATLDSYLATLWFCTMGPHPRYRLTQAELSRPEIFGSSAPINTPHVVSNELGRPQIFRIYSATTDATVAARQLRSKIRELRATPELGSWLDAGDYGFAVLGETKDKVVALKDAIGRLDLFHIAPLVVGLGPTGETLAAVIKQRRNDQ